MNCSLVEQCSFFRVFSRRQCLIYYNTCHRGPSPVVRAPAGRMWRPTMRPEPAAHSLSGFANNKHWENYSCIEAHKAGTDTGNVTQRDHVTHSRKGTARIHPETPKLPFYLHAGPRAETRAHTGELCRHCGHFPTLESRVETLRGHFSDSHTRSCAQDTPVGPLVLGVW